MTEKKIMHGTATGKKLRKMKARMSRRWGDPQYWSKGAHFLTETGLMYFTWRILLQYNHCLILLLFLLCCVWSRVVNFVEKGAERTCYASKYSVGKKKNTQTTKITHTQKKQVTPKNPNEHKCRRMHRWEAILLSGFIEREGYDTILYELSSYYL